MLKPNSPWPVILEIKTVSLATRTASDLIRRPLNVLVYEHISGTLA